jgi:hypothetical protein
LGIGGGFGYKALHVLVALVPLKLQEIRLAQPAGVGLSGQVSRGDTLSRPTRRRQFNHGRNLFYLGWRRGHYFGLAHLWLRARFFLTHGDLYLLPEQFEDNRTTVCQNAS